MFIYFVNTTIYMVVAEINDKNFGIILKKKTPLISHYGNKDTNGDFERKVLT